MPFVISASPDAELVGIAEQNPAMKADLGGQDWVADLRGEPSGLVNGGDGALDQRSAAIGRR